MVGPGNHSRMVVCMVRVSLEVAHIHAYLLQPCPPGVPSRLVRTQYELFNTRICITS